MQGAKKEERFIKWFTENGGRFRCIQQACFQPNNYTGIAAVQDIPKNTIIMAVPKGLIVGIERIRNSELGSIIKKYPIFQGKDNDDKDFNILTLFLIMEKMKGEHSFFAPYLDCIQIAETLVYWPQKDVELLCDPYLTSSFLRQVAADFNPTFLTFQEIAQTHPQLFKQQMTRELFDKMYGVVMTRCFGWGLPQTMLVPFADFLNHHSNGVHHYAFSSSLEERHHPEYIPKGECLNLNIFGIDNSKKLPKGYEKDSREHYIEQNINVLKEKDIEIARDIRNIPLQTCKKYLEIIRSKKARDSFDAQLLLSTDSEDNDSLQEQDYDEQVRKQIKTNPTVRRYYQVKEHFRRMTQSIDARKQPRYLEPKPWINREFEEDVSFWWWYQTKDAQFIVATAKNTAKGEQVFNSYGRRSNRFLLLWYGFTFPDNKYDSVPFRLWSQAVRKQTAKIIFTRYVTEKDWKCRIPIGNNRFSYSELSEQFRLKLPELNYYLIGFLRLQFILSPVFNKYEPINKNFITICDISLQIVVFAEYLQILGLLAKEYRMDPAIGFSSPSHEYFANVLIESDTNILQAHLRGVKHILGLLHCIKERNLGKKDLEKEYGQSWGNEDEQSQARNRIFVGHYYHLLSNYLP